MRQDEKFENRELAAIIASKVHYHLEQFDESLTYALGAGRLFTDQITAGKPSQYVFTILSKVSLPADYVKVPAVGRRSCADFGATVQLCFLVDQVLGFWGLTWALVTSCR